MSSQQLVAVTGANGFLGMQIIEILLHKGVRTRAVVRSERAKRDIESVFEEYAESDLLTFSLVPDMLANEGVYDEAFKGATTVIHSASPIPDFAGQTKDPEAEFYSPAEQGARNALKGANKNKSVKRFVYTGSIAGAMQNGCGELLHENHGSVDRKKAQKFTAARDAYRASKALSERAVWDYVAESKPDFKVTVLLPALLAGIPVNKATDVYSGSNLLVFQWIQYPSQNLERHASIPTVDNRDCAQAHVNAALADAQDDSLDGKRLFVSQRTTLAAEALIVALQKAPSLTKGWSSAVQEQVKSLIGQELKVDPTLSATFIVPEAEEDARLLGVHPLRESLQTLGDLYQFAVKQAAL